MILGQQCLGSAFTRSSWNEPIFSVGRGQEARGHHLRGHTFSIPVRVEPWWAGSGRGQGVGVINSNTSGRGRQSASGRGQTGCSLGVTTTGDSEGVASLPWAGPLERGGATMSRAHSGDTWGPRSPLPRDQVEVVAQRGVVAAQLLRRGVAARSLRFGGVGVDQRSQVGQQGQQHGGHGRPVHQLHLGDTGPTRHQFPRLSVQSPTRPRLALPAPFPLCFSSRPQFPHSQPQRRARRAGQRRRAKTRAGKGGTRCPGSAFPTPGWGLYPGGNGWGDVRLLPSAGYTPAWGCGAVPIYPLACASHALRAALPQGRRGGEALGVTPASALGQRGILPGVLSSSAENWVAPEAWCG